MRYSRQLVVECSTTVWAVVRQGKQVMSRVLVDSVVWIASVHFGAAVGATLPTTSPMARELQFTYRARIVIPSIFNPHPMPHGFCVDGGGSSKRFGHPFPVISRCKPLLYIQRIRINQPHLFTPPSAG